MVDLSRVREVFSKSLNKLLINLCNAAFLLREKKRSLVKILAVAALVANVTLALVGFESINRPFVIDSVGTVNLPVGVEFYWDSNCTNPVLLLDWGDIQPGSTINVIVFAENEGTQAINLDIAAENWTPIETKSYMTFDSNYIGQDINPQENLRITLSLTTSPNIEGITSFSFDINVTVNPA